MNSALRATSLSLAQFVRQRLENDPDLGPLFDAGVGGTMVVSLETPHEMREANTREGLSLWLYRVVRDEMLLNAPHERVAYTQVMRPPLPLRLHYLVTPLINRTSANAPETEQLILGKVLQAFYDMPTLRGADLADDWIGTATELNVRWEPLSLEELTRIWDSLEGPYELSVSYEVTAAAIASDRQPELVSPVFQVEPQYGNRVGGPES